MPFLGGIASGGSFSGVAGPLGGVTRPSPPVRMAPMLNATQPFPNLGRFRRSLNGITTDAINAPLGGVSLHVFSTGTDLEVADIVSDASGVWDVAIYTEGATYYVWAWKAGTPNVFGASDILTPV
jgi:hypothetical protein